MQVKLENVFFFTIENVIKIIIYDVTISQEKLITLLIQSRVSCPSGVLRWKNTNLKKYITKLGLVAVIWRVFSLSFLQHIYLIKQNSQFNENLYFSPNWCFLTCCKKVFNLHCYESFLNPSNLMSKLTLIFVFFFYLL